MAFPGVVLGRMIFVLVVIASSCLECKVTGCRDEERRALLEIKRSINFPNGSALSHWGYWGYSTTKEEKNCCRWEGITCDFNTGRVVGIDLSSQMWRVVPRATWYLNHIMLATFGQLESLNLEYNDITGGIPEIICDLKLLKVLRLSSNNLEGSIPSCLCTLQSLRELHLSFNSLGGNISSCLCTMRSLRVLSLAYNSLKGSIPSCLCTLRSLRILYLEGNSLEGSIPSCMCALRSLRKLYLSNNRLSGDIPSCFSNIRTLTELGLSDNQFQGNYISWLCDMRSLTVLSLSYDRFPSSIPSCLGNLDKLKFLQLAGDEFKCSMPSSIFSNLTKLRTLKIYCGGLKGTFQFPVLANLSKLKYIYFSSNGGLDINTEYPISWVPSFQLNTFIIQDCSLNRNSGNRLPTFLWTQGKLYSLYLWGTTITGTPPIGLFCNSSLSTLSLRWNQFSGPFLLPCHNASQHAYQIDLSFNYLNGSLPENISVSFPKLWTFKMAGNKLEGCIPSTLGHAPLSELDLSDNNLSGELPHTLTRNQSKLQYLNVSYNHLEGEVLPTDADMPGLHHLIVTNNNFTGLLLARLSNSSGLLIIDGGYNKFTDDLSHELPYFPEIKILLLKQNHIQGFLPEQLCQMQYLRFLDLSGNNLSGKLLPCFNNISSWISSSPEKSRVIDFIVRDAHISFTSKNLISPYEGYPLWQMTHLDLSSNMISGIIPREIGELKGLRSLNISSNRIQGSIPVEMACMNTMESLDLSHNSLTGSIPQEMVRLSSLSAFSVAFNILFGGIPSGGQFATFSKSSYEGNPGLCGPPLEKACSSDKERANKNTEAGENKGKSIDFDDALFYSFVTISFILGFWWFLASIFFKVSWRRKYFKFIDEYYKMYLRDI